PNKARKPSDFNAGVTQPTRRAGYALAALLAFSIASHTRDGVAGMSIAVTPSGTSASISALITVGGAPMVPDSPMPLTPSGLVRHGTSSSSELISGMRSARGIA